MAKERWNGPLDLEHLAEEIEDVGSERRDAVRSQVRRIIEHLLKLEHSRARDPRGGWRDSILDARAEIADKLTADDPARRRATSCRDCTSGLARRRPTGCAAHGERRRGARPAGSLSLRVSTTILTDDWYPTNRHGIVDDPD